jgi:hypothetical protein
VTEPTLFIKEDKNPISRLIAFNSTGFFSQTGGAMTALLTFVLPHVTLLP